MVKKDIFLYNHPLIHYLLSMNRNRIHYFLYIITTIAIGLCSRMSFVPEILLPYAGDVLYTTMIFFTLGWLFPTMPSLKVALISIAICFLIEFSQFYQADWINELRSNRLGGLILGFGFKASDLVCYALGGMLGYSLERFIMKKREKLPFKSLD